MDGLLLIDKPKNWTSFDVVAKVRNVLRTETRKQQIENSSPESSLLIPNSSLLSTPSKKVKVGHTGTLDPLATGLLVLTIGKYCKRAAEFSKLDKTYQVVMKLGETSTTGDNEGQKVVTSTKRVAKHELLEAMNQFVGEIDQVPPAYSAIKINGQRAYKLARAGKEVVMESRRVTIHSIEEIEFDYPEVKFEVRVSSGTYVRSLVEDIGAKLGTGAYMSDLRRTQVGQYDISQAMKIEDLSGETVVANLKLLPEVSS